MMRGVPSRTKVTSTFGYLRLEGVDGLLGIGVGLAGVEHQLAFHGQHCRSCENGGEPSREGRGAEDLALHLNLHLPIASARWRAGSPRR